MLAAATPERLARLRADVLNQKAERRLRDFLPLQWSVVEPGTPYLRGWFHDYLCEHLEAVSAGEINRLIVNIPPRYGKSNTISVGWPTWEWLRNPAERWIFASYSAPLSTKHSVDRRNVLQSRWYREAWGDRFRLTSDQNVKSYYANDRRGEMYATSVGGSLTGLGGNRLIIDDPHNPREAESELERQQAIDWYRNTLVSRLNDKRRGAIVLVMQRLHQSDLTGYLLEAEPGAWVHVKLPGEAPARAVVRFPRSGREVVREQGDPLHPEREGKAELAKVRSAMGSYAYAGQYDQEPAPPGGGMFQVARLGIVEAVPQMAKLVRYWDKAATEGGGCNSAGVLMGRGADGLFYVLHVVAGHWSPSNREAAIKQTAQVDGTGIPVWHEQEPGSSGVESAQNTNLSLAGWDVRAERPTGSKVERAGPFSAQVEAGNIRLLKGEWNREYLDELRLFPFGKLKDRVDASSGAFNKLALAPLPGRAAAGGKVEGPKGVL